MTATDDKTALLIIDVQEGLDEPRLGARNNPAAESNMARLLADWRAHHRPGRVASSGTAAKPVSLRWEVINSSS